MYVYISIFSIVHVYVCTFVMFVGICIFLTCFFLLLISSYYLWDSFFLHHLQHMNFICSFCCFLIWIFMSLSASSSAECFCHCSTVRRWATKYPWATTSNFTSQIKCTKLFAHYSPDDICICADCCKDRALTAMLGNIADWSCWQRFLKILFRCTVIVR